MRRYGAIGRFRRSPRVIRCIQTRSVPGSARAIEGLAEVFSNGGERRARDHESEVRELHARNGELIVERDSCLAGPLDEPGRASGDGGGGHPALSLSRQCRLLSIGRSSLYYTPKGESAETLAPMRRIDALFLKSPFYGARQMVRHLRREGVRTGRAKHVWCADIPDIPVQRGFLYLVAIMDWASCHVLAWRLPNTLDAGFCTDAWEEALARYGTPEIFNTDQGSQVTSFAFTGRLREVGIGISMDGRGRCMDTIFIERLWRSLKYEGNYIPD